MSVSGPGGRLSPIKVTWPEREWLWFPSENWDTINIRQGKGKSTDVLYKEDHHILLILGKPLPRMGDKMLPSRWGPGAGRKGNQAWCQSAVPAHPGWREFSGSEICSLRTCLYFCNFYFLLYKVEGKPKGNKVPFKNANLSVLYELAYEDRRSLLWRLGKEKRGIGTSGGKGNVWEAPPPGKRHIKVGRGRGFFLHKLSPGKFKVPLIAGNHLGCESQPCHFLVAHFIPFLSLSFPICKMGY